MLNIAAIIGRLTADPELRKTQSGLSVVNATVACERNYAKQGEKREVDFIEIIAWRNTAEFIYKYFSKGSMIALNGSIQTSTYTDKNDQKRKKVELLVSDVNFCGETKKNNNLDVEPPKQEYTPESYSSGEQQDFGIIDDSEDLPF